VRVAVVGCGTAGPAASLFLDRAGHDVTLFERVEKPGPVGAGILLQPTGMEVLHALGLLPVVLAKARRVDRLLGRAGGRTIMDLRYGDLGDGWFGAGLHRGVLFQTLLAAVEESTVQRRFGASVSAIEDGEPAWLIVDDERVGPFKLVVVADGARSTLRRFAGPIRREQTYPWGAIWAVVPMPPNWAQPHALSQVYRGCSTMLGFLPTGLSHDGDTELLSVFWSLRADGEEALRGRGIDAWKADIVELAPEAEGLLGSLDDFDALPFAGYMDVVMRPRGRRTIVLGDAAHAMSPQLGQGANFALHDAALLARSLAQHEDVDRALTACADGIQRRLQPFQRLTRMLTPAFQSNQRWLGVARDALLGPLCRFPPTRALMLDSMSGRRAAPFGWSPAALPPPGTLQ